MSHMRRFLFNPGACSAVRFQRKRQLVSSNTWLTSNYTICTQELSSQLVTFYQTFLPRCMHIVYQMLSDVELLVNTSGPFFLD